MMCDDLLSCFTFKVVNLYKASRSVIYLLIIIVWSGVVCGVCECENRHPTLALQFTEAPLCNNKETMSVCPS